MLMQIGRAVGSCRDLDALLGAVSRHVAAAFGADRACLYLHNETKLELWTRVFPCDDAHPHEIHFPADHGLCGRVFATHRPLCIADTLEAPRFARDAASQNGWLPHSMLLAPIMNGHNRCIGVLQVMDRRVAHFAQEDLPLLEAVAEMAALAIENARLRDEQQTQFKSLVASISAALDARDILTATHSRNVANYAVGVGVILDLSNDDLQRLHVAGLLHDVGKIGVPEVVLTKAGRLTAAELEEIRQHAQYTKEILSRVQFADALRGVDTIAAAHHERLDGSGYPDGLVADQLPLLARILAVADIFDALTQTRHHRLGMSVHEALAELEAMTPQQLDRCCVAALKAFLRCGPWPAPECDSTP